MSAGSVLYLIELLDCGPDRIVVLERTPVRPSASGDSLLEARVNQDNDGGVVQLGTG